jgi:N-acetylglutamate synthase-like GNAT family acetyltransferase
VTIRPAQYADLAAVRALLAAEGLPDEDIGVHLATLWVGVHAGRIVAAGALEPLGAACLLRSVVIAPAHRDRGWGRRMTRHLLRFAARLGMSRVYLLTTTAADFFAGLDFVTEARERAPPTVQASRQFRVLCPVGATLMKLRDSEARAVN